MQDIKEAFINRASLEDDNFVLGRKGLKAMKCGRSKKIGHRPL